MAFVYMAQPALEPYEIALIVAPNSATASAFAPGKGPACGTPLVEDKVLFVAGRNHLRLFRPFYSAV